MRNRSKSATKLDNSEIKPAPVPASEEFLSSGPVLPSGQPEGEKKASEQKPAFKTAPAPRISKDATVKLPMPDPVNEIVVIGAALVSLEARARLVKQLPPDNFFAKGHSEAWSVICELERRGLAYDPLTVKQMSGGKVDTNYLDNIIRDRPELPTNLEHHVEIMKWDRTRVEVIKGPLSGLVEAIRDPLTDPEIVKKNAEQIVGVLKSSGTHKYLRDPSTLVREQMASIRARRGGAACYPYGIDGFDIYGPDEKLDDGTDVSGTWRIVPGTAPKGTTVITGVSGSGKTTVTANVALAQANLERRVLFGAWEQGDRKSVV